MIAKATLNPQAWAIEEIESEIRRLVMNGVIQKRPKSVIDKEFKILLQRNLNQIDIPELRAAALTSLTIFYQKQYKTALRLYGSDVSTLLLLLSLTDRQKTEGERKKIFDKLPPLTKNDLTDFRISAPTYGVPNREYVEDYVNEKLKPTIDELCRQFAKDPDDVSGRNSLRNRAEMEVRYNKHLTDIAVLRAAGVRLVIASTHSDCSERCRPLQGRVYSLDGTSGTTDDGRPFVPLETATDIWYTTKAGKRYKNGLLGFNCRHFLVEYKSGYQFPKPNAKEERREYEITLKQRYLERQTRKWRVEALTSQLADKKRYQAAVKKAKYWNSLYESFSKKHERAFYRSRVQII